MRTEIFLVLGMSIATMIPRLLPVWLISKLKLTSFTESWLKGVPYASLGALIFPGILNADPGSEWTGILGGTVAFMFALSRLPAYYAVIFAVITASVFKLIESS
ncbi:AzlD domain-containing protein [Nostoc sp. UHCC 0702]|nr:AzlD domain-containing protein [Nostoc sp. UHCC 0702]